MEFKSFPFFDLKIEDERQIRSIFSVLGNCDDGGDRILPGAFRKTIQEGMPKGRVKVLWQHDASEPPIGVMTNLKELGQHELPDALKQACPDATGALLGEWRALDTPRANEVLAGIRAGAITENSIGYDPVKVAYPSQQEMLNPNHRRDLKELKLYEGSPVLWGMNSATLNMKAALPFKETPTADSGTAWDGPAVLKELNDAAHLRMACAWVDPEGDPDAKSSYKLPHHEPDGKVVLKGVQAAMGALLGSRGGVDIPEADRKAVYNHLAKHYEQFDATPPDFKFAQFCWVTAEIKAGRRLSADSINQLTGHAQMMGDHAEQMRGQIDNHAAAMAGHIDGIQETIQDLLKFVEGAEPDESMAKAAVASPLTRWELKDRLADLSRVFAA